MQEKHCDNLKINTENGTQTVRSDGCDEETFILPLNHGIRFSVLSGFAKRSEKLLLKSSLKTKIITKNRVHIEYIIV
jgi:hypothetical protein